MMIQIWILDPVTLSIVVSGLMLFVALVIAIVISLFRGGKISTEGSEMYIGGENEDVLKYRVPSVIALYWGIVKRAWRKAFEYLRDAVHTGVLNDWYGFMSSWLGFLLLIALIAILVYLIM
ncbi:MAG: hypothetical protein QXG46_05380 [Ignisphaera sp.]|uniref:Sodium:proton antiporter n=1 Tax=Ignisphaera aggregans TaxID=334771 RepID=A0A7C4D029_9CREN